MGFIWDLYGIYISNSWDLYGISPRTSGYNDVQWTSIVQNHEIT